MSAVCSHLHQQRQHSSVYATWGVPAHSVVVVVAAELVPLAGLLAVWRSVLGLHLVLDLVPDLDLACEPEPEPEPGCGVEARRTFVVVLVPVLLPLFDVHQLSDFDLELVPACKTAYWRPRPYWALHKLVDLSLVEGIRDGVAGFGVAVAVGAEAAVAEAGQQAARVDVENCWAPYCRQLPSRAKRARA